MKKLIYISLAFLFITGTITAQSNGAAVKLVENALNLIKQNAVNTDFTMSMKQGAQSQTMNGNIIMQGNKFTLKMDEMSVFFDGKTQWAYMNGTNEVSISNPSEKELIETNPISILNAYKAKSFINFGKSVSNTITAINLLPKDYKADITKITLNINKSNNYPVSIQVTDKKKSTTNLTLKNFKVNQKVSADTFVFNPKNYKDVEINDLR